MQLSAQRHLFAVDLGAHCAVANIAVNGIGKVHDGRAARHGHELALGREHVDRIWKKINLDVIPELGRIARFVLNVQQRLQPLRAQAL